METQDYSTVEQNTRVGHEQKDVHPSGKVVLTA
jgi:hypothetical protein